jgi:hypothetical protein
MVKLKEGIYKITKKFSKIREIKILNQVLIGKRPIKRSFTQKRQFHIFIAPSPALKLGEPPLRKKKEE